MANAIKTLKHSQSIACSGIQDAAQKASMFSNAVIVAKGNDYSVVTEKTYAQLKPMGYNLVRKESN